MARMLITCFVATSVFQVWNGALIAGRDEMSVAHNFYICLTESISFLVSMRGEENVVDDVIL